jgi:argininosuccinate lyase
MDLVLAKYDALFNCPCKNVGQIGLLTTAETESLVAALEEIIVDVEKEISIEDSFEDVHSKIEYLLTAKLGDAGKKFTACSVTTKCSLMYICI